MFIYKFNELKHFFIIFPFIYTYMHYLALNSSNIITNFFFTINLILYNHLITISIKQFNWTCFLFFVSLPLSRTHTHTRCSYVDMLLIKLIIMMIILRFKSNWWSSTSTSKLTYKFITTTICFNSVSSYLYNEYCLNIYTFWFVLRLKD